MSPIRRFAVVGAVLLALGTTSVLALAAEPVAFGTEAAMIERVVQEVDPDAKVNSRYRPPEESAAHGEYRAIDLDGNDATRCQEIADKLGGNYRVISEKL